MMKEQLQKRLESLKSEFESGQKALSELEQKQISLREVLLRISGAVQVLEEELETAEKLEEQSSENGQSEIVHESTEVFS